MPGPRLRIEVVDARPEVQRVVRLELEDGCTAGEAAERSGLLPPGTPAVLGVHGAKARPETRLRDGDRVDLLRPLVADPKEARRARARDRRRRRGVRR